MLCLRISIYLIWVSFLYTGTHIWLYLNAWTSTDMNLCPSNLPCIQTYLKISMHYTLDINLYLSIVLKCITMAFTMQSLSNYFNVRTVHSMKYAQYWYNKWCTDDKTQHSESVGHGFVVLQFLFSWLYHHPLAIYTFRLPTFSRNASLVHGPP